jgi:hypothetical protein
VTTFPPFQKLERELEKDYEVPTKEEEVHAIKT